MVERLAFLALGLCDRCLNDAGIDDLPTALDVGMGLQLLVHRLEDCPIVQSPLGKVLLEAPQLGKRPANAP